MKKIVLPLVVIIVLVWIGVLYLLFADFESLLNKNRNTNTGVTVSSTEMKKFKSEKDFKEYLQAVAYNVTNPYVAGFGAMALTTDRFMIEESADVGLGVSELKATPDRVSTTNVQVASIDEPDYVKTDGQSIFFSPQESHYSFTISDFPTHRTSGKTRVIKAFPVNDLEKKSEIDKNGLLLLQDNILIIFTGDTLYGYDVSKPESPKEVWKMELDSRNYMVSSRLFKSKIYLVTRASVSMDKPCPIKPLIFEGKPLTIECDQIYRPETEVPVDVTYTAFIIDPKTGKVEKNVSFVGYTQSSVIYMSENALYVTYSFFGDYIDYYYGFIQALAQDLFSLEVKEKIKKLSTYEISNQAKMTEFSLIFSQYFSSLSEDEQLKISNELENRMDTYYKKHQRDLEKTGIVKISLGDFKVLANGLVPGHPLNQFSLDEYQGNLRIAVTVGDQWGLWSGSGEEVNDVYVLDSDLKETGKILDMGKGERIYSARFIKDKGYLVTFKQIDPFFVLDLSNPKNPQVKGELKIPGFSSYLHPLKTNLILGVGKEGSNVKLSLFDVSQPEKPIEKDKYQLDEYFTDVQNTHHAFLMDPKHEVFFLPASKGGYVFSYKDNKLSIVKAISTILAKRAVYINDYLYIIGQNEIIVINELDWQEVNSLEL